MKPTYEDITKYHSQATRLLVDIECYSLPMEIQITKVIDGGAMFAFANGWNTQWVKTEQVDVLHVFPPKELTKRLWDLEEAEKKKARKQDHKEIHEIINRPVGGVLTSKQLSDLFSEVYKKPLPPLPKPKKLKKCKKKKNSHTESSK